MKRQDLKKISNLLYFTRQTLLSLDPALSKPAWELAIYRWLKSGEIILLKRGLYVSRQTYERYQGNGGFLEFIGAKLLYPSYLSLEYVLRKYEILTEVTFGLTLVTTKIGRLYNNKLNSFFFRHIKTSLFTGYKVAYFLDHEYYIASKAKALFDWLYFKSAFLPGQVTSKNWAEELRLNLDNFSQSDWAELKYFSGSAPKKLAAIIDNLITHAPVAI